MNRYASSASIFELNSTLQAPVRAERLQIQTRPRATGLLSRALQWIREHQATRSNSKRLQVSDMASLGQKRFVAVVEIDGNRFLVGGGATEVSLLARLNENEPFSGKLEEVAVMPAPMPAPETAKRGWTKIVNQRGEEA